jgi:hypothetical protein
MFADVEALGLPGPTAAAAAAADDDDEGSLSLADPSSAAEDAGHTSADGYQHEAAAAGAGTASDSPHVARYAQNAAMSEMQSYAAAAAGMA